MKTISRYIMTLALLITAATGAWAVGVGAKIGTTEYATLDQAISSAQDGDIIQLQSDAALTESIIVEKRITIDYNGYIISRVGNTYGGIFWNVDMTFTDSDDTGRGGMKCNYGLYTGSNAKANLCGGRYDDSAETFLTGEHAFSYHIPTGYEIVNINADGSADADGFKSRVVRNYLNDTKTVATIPMPANDVDVNYELVRDMSVQMQAQVGDDHAKQPRYRVQWNGERWVPADMEYEEVMALFSVNDLIEKKILAPVNYLVSIYAVDDEGKPTGDAMNFKTFTFAPGRYYVTASPNTLLEEPVPYEGTTAPSNIFELFQGYEIKVAAGEYATFYKDENLYTEDEDAVLYTIANVTDTEAQLSDAIKVAPAETPLLVYNNSEESKTFLLIPTTEQAAEVTPAKEFMGSITSVELNASSSTADYYALNGKAFVWVKGTINIGANKCWLQIDNQPAAARATTRSITGGGDTTGINAIDSEQLTDDNYYDLQGRKVEKPNRKGIYIHNGQKVVVR